MAHSASKASDNQANGQQLASQDEAKRRAQFCLEQVIEKVAKLPPTRESMQFFSDKIIQYEKEHEAFKQRLEKYMGISNDRKMLELELLNRGEKITALRRAIQQLQDTVRSERQKITKLEAEVQQRKLREEECHLRIQQLLKITENTPLHDNIIYIFKKPYPLSISQRLLGVRQDENQTKVKQVASESSETYQMSAEVASGAVNLLKEQIDDLQNQMEFQNKLMEERVAELVKDCSANIEEADAQNCVFKEKITSLINKLKETEDDLKRTNCELLDTRRALRQQEISLYVRKSTTSMDGLEGRASTKSMSDAAVQATDPSYRLISSSTQNNFSYPEDQSRVPASSRDDASKSKWQGLFTAETPGIKGKAKSTFKYPCRSASDSLVGRMNRLPQPIPDSTQDGGSEVQGSSSKSSSISGSSGSIRKQKSKDLELSTLNVIIPGQEVPPFSRSSDTKEFGSVKRDAWQPVKLPSTENSSRFTSYSVGRGNVGVRSTASCPSVSERQRKNAVGREVQPRSWLGSASWPKVHKEGMATNKVHTASGPKSTILKNKSGKTEYRNKFQLRNRSISLEKHNGAPSKSLAKQVPSLSLSRSASVSKSHKVAQRTRSAPDDHSVLQQSNKCDVISQTSPKPHRIVSSKFVSSTDPQTVPNHAYEQQTTRPVGETPTTSSQGKQPSAGFESSYRVPGMFSKDVGASPSDIRDNAVGAGGPGDSESRWQFQDPLEHSLSGSGGIRNKIKLIASSYQEKSHTSTAMPANKYEHPDAVSNRIRDGRSTQNQFLPSHGWVYTADEHESSKCTMCSKSLPRQTSSSEATADLSYVSIPLPKTLPKSHPIDHTEFRDESLRHAISQLEKSISSKISDFRKSNANSDIHYAEPSFKASDNVNCFDKAVQTIPLRITEQSYSSEFTSPSDYVDILHLVSHERCEKEIDNLKEKLKKQADEFQELRQKAENDRFYTKEAAAQCRRLEEQLQFEKEHRDAYILPYQNQNKELIEQLKLSRSQLQRLDQFRRLEVEGFRTDIKNLTDKIKKIEKHIMKALVQFESSENDLELLKTVHRTTKHSERVTNEIKRLKAKLYQIENDIRNL